MMIKPHKPFCFRLLCKCLAALLLVFMLPLLPVGCNQKTAGSQLVIGVDLALTGVSAPYGNNCLRGITLAVNAKNKQGGIDGRQIVLRVMDNASRSDLSGLVAMQLEQAPEVAAILGPSLSHLVKAAAEQLVQKNLLTPGATADLLCARPDKTRLFRICFTDAVQGRALAGYAIAMGKKRAAVLVDAASDYSKGISKRFASAYEQMGGQVVAFETYPPKEVDFYPLLTKVSAYHPDLLFVPGFYEQGGLLIAQAAELNLNIPVFSGDGFDSPVLRSIVANPAALERVYFTDHVLPDETSAFGSAYQKTFGIAPAAYSALGFDSALVLLDALERTDCNLLQTNPAAFHAMLEKQLLATNLTGATGHITFDCYRNAVKTPVLLTYRSNRLVEVNLSDSAFSTGAKLG